MIPCFYSYASWICTQNLKLVINSFSKHWAVDSLQVNWSLFCTIEFGSYQSNCFWVVRWINFLCGSDYRSHWLKPLIPAAIHTPLLSLFGGAYPAVEVPPHMQFLLITLQKWRWVGWGLALILGEGNKEKVWMWSPGLGRLEHEGEW